MSLLLSKENQRFSYTDQCYHYFLSTGKSEIRFPYVYGVEETVALKSVDGVWIDLRDVFTE